MLCLHPGLVIHTKYGFLLMHPESPDPASWDPGGSFNPEIPEPGVLKFQLSQLLNWLRNLLGFASAHGASDVDFLSMLT